MVDFKSKLLNSMTNTDLKTGVETTPLQKRQEIIDKAAADGLNIKEIKDIILDTSKAQLIESIAGSGKTTVLNLKIIADRYSGASDGKRVWVNTFLKTGIEDMEHSFYARCNSIGQTVPKANIYFSTLHSEFYTVLKQIGVNIKITDAKQLQALLKKVLKDFRLGQNNGYLDNEQVSTIQTLITRYRSNLGQMPFSVFELDDVKELGITQDILTSIVKLYKDARRRLTFYDFEDLQELLYEYLIVKPNPALINLISTRYSYIYLDEFQDVSRIQYEILKVYFSKADQIFAVGDSDQSIYSWRGSDISIITRDYPFDFEPSKHYLTTNYRVPQAILDPIANSIKKAPRRVEKAITAYNTGGTFDVVALKSKEKLLGYLVSELAKDQSSGKNIAIMASTNATLTDLALYLNMQKKFKYDIEIRGNLVNLDSFKYAKYIRLAYIFTDADALKFLKSNIETLDYAARRNGVSTKLNELLRNEGLSVLSLNQQQLNDFSKGLADWGMAIGLDNLVEQINKTINNSNGNQHEYKQLMLDAYYNTLVYLRDKQKQSKSDYADANTTILNLLISVIKFDEDVNSPDSFLFKMNEHTEKLKSQFNKTGAQIILTTPFEFKGKETDITYVLEDTDYNFPRKRSEKTQYNEERRLHYIAGTRARQKCVYTTIIGHVSPFIKEMEVEINKPLIQPLSTVLSNLPKPTDATGSDNDFESLSADELISEFNFD